VSSKINHYKIQDFKLIESIEGNPIGKNVYVIGKNQTGKSTLIDAIWSVLDPSFLPDEPIKKGKTSSTIEVDFGNYKCTVLFKKTKQGKISRTLTVVNASTFEEIKSPRALVDSLAGASVSFSIDKFLELSDKLRAEYLANAIGLGSEFRMLSLRFQEEYDDRRIKNKELKILEAKFEPYDEKHLLIEVDNIGQMTSELAVAKQSQDVYNRACDLKQQLEKRVEAINLQMQELEKEKLGLFSRIQVGNDFINNPVNWPADSEKITILEYTVNNFSDAKLLRDAAIQNSTIQISIETTKVEISECNTEIGNISHEIGALVSKKLGIPGLVFDIETNKLFLNDLPLEKQQINTAELIKIGLMISSKMISENQLRIVRFDGSLVDDDNLGIIQVWAEENDIQLFVEIMDRSTEELTVIIDE